MLFTRKKITTIVDELTTFFFSVGSDDMVVKIKQKPEGFHIFFASNFDVKMQKTVEHLEENLTRRTCAGNRRKLLGTQWQR